MQKNPTLEELRWWLRGHRWRDLMPRQTYRIGGVKYRARAGIFMNQFHIVVMAKGKFIAALPIKHELRIWQQQLPIFSYPRILLNPKLPVASGIQLSEFTKIIGSGLTDQDDNRVLGQYIVGPLDDTE